MKNSTSLILFTVISLVVLSHDSLVASTGVVGRHAMVVSAHPLASAVGVRILKRGGNAVDAAVAVQFALAVVYPNAGNIGGGGFMVWRGRKSDCATLDFRETAPALSSRDMYLDSAGNVVPNLSLDGHLSCGVPGSVAGMAAAYTRFGKLPWRDLVQPAVDLARKGFRITEKQAEDLNEFHADLEKWNEHSSPLVKSRPWRAGDVLRQPELAATFERIRDKGRDGFYAGRTAQLIVDEMKSAGGIISEADLADYHPVWREPVIQSFNHCKIITMPPPSSGGIALLQLLKMWESRATPTCTFHSVDAVHLMAECERRVYADRAEWLGDPDFVHVPMKGLLSEKYLKERMKDFRTDSATPSSRVKAGEANAYESEETTHFSIVDKDGNAVAVTTTLNASYGSKVVVRGAGFLLNNEMDDFSSKPGTPNFYRLLGNEANAIAPHKRMLSSMTPTIVERHGEVMMVVGTPGGGTIITSVFQTILNVTVFGMTMKEAVEAKRFHHQWMPDQIAVETGCLDEEVLRQLQSRGHRISQRGSMGRVDAILMRNDGTLEGAADERGDDAALGY